jgi:hypothetical protein
MKTIEFLVNYTFIEYNIEIFSLNQKFIKNFINQYTNIKSKKNNNCLLIFLNKTPIANIINNTYNIIKPSILKDITNTFIKSIFINYEQSIT